LPAVVNGFELILPSFVDFSPHSLIVIIASDGACQLVSQTLFFLGYPHSEPYETRHIELQHHRARHQFDVQLPVRHPLAPA
jgi:hypothetical protein